MMKLNKPRTARTTFVRDLNTAERFVLPGQTTVYVCQSRRNGEGGTRVVYRVEGSDMQHEMVKSQMSTVYLLD